MDHIEVERLGGRSCPSIYWLTMDGWLYGLDYRRNSGLHEISLSTSDAVFRELLERLRSGRDGYCQRHQDGVDVDVSISIGGQTYFNECTGGKWFEFRRRFFELVDEARDRWPEGE